MRHQLLILTAFFALAASAQGGSLNLIYTGDADVNDNGNPLVAAGDLVTFDFILDFSGTPTYGGGFNINWDIGVFDFVSYTAGGLGDAGFGRDPDFTPGSLTNGGVGSFVGLTGPDLVASLVFVYNGGMGTVTTGPTGGLHSDLWLSTDGVSLLDVEYGGVSFIPVPAALWLFLSGGAALAGLARRVRPAI